MRGGRGGAGRGLDGGLDPATRVCIAVHVCHVSARPVRGSGAWLTLTNERRAGMMRGRHHACGQEGRALGGGGLHHGARLRGRRSKFGRRRRAWRHRKGAAARVGAEWGGEGREAGVLVRGAAYRARASPTAAAASTAPTRQRTTPTPRRGYAVRRPAAPSAGAPPGTCVPPRRACGAPARRAPRRPSASATWPRGGECV